MKKRVIPLTFFALVIFFLARSAGAQAAPTATLYPVDTSQFPTLSAYLDVRDDAGRFVAGLQASDLRILENNRSLQVDSLTQSTPGTQFVLAIAPGDSLGIRDSLGATRYANLIAPLADWAGQLPVPPLDDLSLVIDGGPQVIHTADVNLWLTALQTFTPVSKENASLQVLSAALDTADDPTDREGMSRVVLLITSPLLEGAEAGLPNLVNRATQAGIRIYVWFVAAPEFFDSPSAILFQDLAVQTGGEYFAFSRQESIPDLEAYLQPLRSVYRLAYTSQVTASGTQQVAAEINTLAIQTISAARQYEIDVQPPNPIFISPPSEIARTEAQLTGPGGQKLTPAPDQDLLTPAKQPLEVLIEFPDGHPRPIITSTLYVDGVVAAQNGSAPFEQFTWDLRPYTAEGRHTLRVEVVDSLGLAGKTVDFPVRVLVTRTPVSVVNVVSQRAGLLVGSVVVVTGVIVVLVLVLGGRIRPRQPGRGRPTEKRLRNGRDIATRPLTTPVSPLATLEDNANSRWPSWFRRPQRQSTPAAFAFLTPLSESESIAQPISLAADDLSLGSSPAHVSIVLDDPSLEKLHARMRREADTYRVLDENSVAGTWVNYLPVSSKGVLLAHGDIVHIGRMKLRFTLRKPGHIRKPVIRQQENGA